jgi:hypothetical protein
MMRLWFLAATSIALTAGAAHCSEITILTPQPGEEVDSLTVPVAFRLGAVFANTEPELTIEVDGKPAPTRRGMKVVSEGPALQEVTVVIPPKSCEISLSALAPDGSKHRATVSIKYNDKGENESKRLYILAVGISDYANNDLDLKLAAKDAQDFVEAMLLQRGNLYSDVEVRKLLNTEATREAIMEGLHWLSTSVTQHDRAILFMAGHGENDKGSFFFLPTDADVDKIMVSCIRWTEIQDTVNTMPCQTVVFLDACHSGGISGRRAVPMDMTSVLSSWQQTPTTAGSAMFSSSTGRQYSKEKEEWGNGAFTKALLEGLSGKAINEPFGEITLKQLDAFISERVKEITDGAQSPTTSFTPDLPDFPVAFAGCITAHEARMRKQQELESALEQAAVAINSAFRASQMLFHAKAKVERLQALNSDGFADDAIVDLRKQIDEHQSTVDENLAFLNKLAGADASIAVAKALAAREAQLVRDLEAVTADQTAEVAKTAFRTIKQQIKLPDHH